MKLYSPTMEFVYIPSDFFFKQKVSFRNFWPEGHQFIVVVIGVLNADTDKPDHFFVDL